MSLFEEVAAEIEKKAEQMDAFGKKIKLILDDKEIIIDGNTTPPSIQADDNEVDITVIATTEVFSKILTKEMNPQMALMTGKIKIKGDMMAAVPLMKIF
ncbi:MAG: SCP2 sterol-binding domain-containing protein [Spongiibacteraceae bacterium]